MSMEYLLGIVCGVAIGLILIMFLLKWTKKDGSSRCKFDERQQLVRGRGFKYAFFSLVICNAVYAAADTVMEDKLMDVPMGICSCVVISVGVYACYCIWNEGYFALNESPKRVLVAFILIALLNFAVFARSVIRNGIFENGVLSTGCMNLLCGVLFLVIFAVLLLKQMQNRREAE